MAQKALSAVSAKPTRMSATPDWQHTVQVHANGVEFVCLTQGSGPLLLLLSHGFTDIPHSWSAQMDALSQAGYKVVAPYLPGYLPCRVADNACFDKASLVHGIAGLMEAI